MFQKKMDNLKKTLKRDWQYWLLLALPLTYLIIFKYYPMLGAQIAFRDYKVRDGIWGSEWVGLKNFIKFFKSYQFTRVVGNTLILSLYYQIVSNIFPIIFALIFNCVEKERLKKVVQTIVTLPHFISTVVLVGILMQILNSRTGLYGIAMEAITGEYPSDLFAKAGNFRHIYTWSGVWQNFGWSSIIYIAALSSVSPELHEAAQIDGASRLKRMWHIDIPAILPTIAIQFILRCTNIIAVGFEKAYLLQSPLNESVSEVISTYVYKEGMSSFRSFSYGAAVGLFNTTINLVLLLSVNFGVRRATEGEISLF